ncbi:MAG: hypothetical protein HKN42_04860 [Granulosicoccus sp.]|nr:hypothetical protein [Granulosicoccus sp.]
MASDPLDTVRKIVSRQVFRSDYLVIDEQTPLRTRLTYELKLERLHRLCLSGGYRSAAECELIRQQLFSGEDRSDRPVILTLAEAYLPSRIERLSLDLACQLARSDQLHAHALQQFGEKMAGSRISWLDWNAARYLMCLPDDIHSLLIDKDGALLAA